MVFLLRESFFGSIISRQRIWHLGHQQQGHNIFKLTPELFRCWQEILGFLFSRDGKVWCSCQFELYLECDWSHLSYLFRPFSGNHSVLYCKHSEWKYKQAHQSFYWIWSSCLCWQPAKSILNNNAIIWNPRTYLFSDGFFYVLP